MINTLIFDLDGTLVDSIADLGLATNMALEKLGLPTHEIDKYRFFVGNGTDKLLERALPEDRLDQHLEARKLFDKYYNQVFLKNTKPYPGIKDLIDELEKQGYNLAVVTNKPIKYAKEITEALFPGQFSYIFGDNKLQPIKPSPVITNLVIDLFDVTKQEVVFIGDSNVDIENAKNAKVKSIGCDWGFRGHQELEESGAEFIAFKAQDILDKINEWNK